MVSILKHKSDNAILQLKPLQWLPSLSRKISGLLTLTYKPLPDVALVCLTPLQSSILHSFCSPNTPCSCLLLCLVLSVPLHGILSLIFAWLSSSWYLHVRTNVLSSERHFFLITQLSYVLYHITQFHFLNSAFHHLVFSYAFIYLATPY